MQGHFGPPILYVSKPFEEQSMHTQFPHAIVSLGCTLVDHQAIETLSS